jgi:N-ethylmaleimide reductase
MKLFAPLTLGSLTLPNRIVMAPMTRSRADANGVPAPFAADYYSQRADSGLIITEGTYPGEGGKGYSRTPGICTPEQIEGWRKVTSAVHAKGGHIFLQIMHVGRIAHPANRTVPDQPVAPSAVRAETTQMWTDSQGNQPLPTPRALGPDEIPAIIDEFRQATKNAIAAGFDGVELHAASGYLPMQFLNSGSNLRTDEYGGTAENRIRFVMEVLHVMIEAAGASQRVGIKISPEMKFNDIFDAEPQVTYSTLAKALGKLNLAYLHVMRAGSPADYVGLVRPLFRGPVLVGGGFSGKSGEAFLEAGSADAIVYGSSYVANPDLVERIRTDAPFTPPDSGTFFTPGPKGYSDYPTI